MTLTPDDIQEILRIFADSSLEELRIQVAGTDLYVSKHAGGLGTLSVPATAPSALPHATPSLPAPDGPGPAQDGVTADAGGPGEPESELAGGALAPADQGSFRVLSPLLGVFYRRPAPGEQPFVEVGAEVSADTPVCIVDVMKMFTKVAAGAAGQIVEICVEDGQLVEHGQLLMRIAPR